MPKDKRPYITVDVGMPDHPKIVGLSDAAFRLLVTAWCWSRRQRTDGHIVTPVWNTLGRPKARRELQDAGLAEPTDAGVYMHDFTEHQWTAAEIDDMHDAKTSHGQQGAHARWHRKKRVDGCPICYPDQPETPMANE